MEDAGPGRVYRSAALAVAMQWSLRLIGLVSVFILARLLSPSDFGLVALATAAVMLVEIFSVIGLRQALLRIPSPERAHLDTAFTIQLILFAALAALTVAVAPAAAAFYREPALALVVAVLALRFLFLGLVNIGIVDFERHLDFGRDLKMRVGARLAAFAVTLTAALLLRSYWALVIGMVLQSGLFAAASWIMHPYRPRLSLARRAELLGVSGWMFLNHAAQDFHHEVERLVLGRVAGMHLVGLYSVSKDLSSIFTQEIATALNRVTFVTTARTGRPLAEQPKRVAAMLGAYAMIAAPTGLGLAAVAENAAVVLLGRPWAAAAPLLALIAPASALYAVYKLVPSSLQAAGLARGGALLSLGGALAAAAAVGGTAFAGLGAQAVAAAALLVSLALLGTGILVLARVAGTGAGEFAAPIARPFAAACAMLLLVRLAGPETGSTLFDLAAGVALGATAYAAFLALLWLAARRPAGAEAEAVSLLAGLAAQRRRASRST